MNGDPSCVPESEPVAPSSPPPPSSDVPASDESIVAGVPLHPATTPIAIAVTTYEQERMENRIGTEERTSCAAKSFRR